MWKFVFIFSVFFAVSRCSCDDENGGNATKTAGNLTSTTSVIPIVNVTAEVNTSRRNVAVPAEILMKPNKKNVIETRKDIMEDSENELDGVVLALSMKKRKNGPPKWYKDVKSAAVNLFSGLSQRRFKPIRFRGQDPSVTIDLKPEAVVPALNEVLSSKQVQKVLNDLASKAAVVYRAFQDDYVKDKKARRKPEI